MPSSGWRAEEAEARFHQAPEWTRRTNDVVIAATWADHFFRL
jgi:hypothetical protein